MSPAPTSVTGVVCPKTGTPTNKAAAHASTTHASYLAAWLRMSRALNPVLSLFKGAIFLSPYPAHGSGLVASYLSWIVTTPLRLTRSEQHPTAGRPPIGQPQLAADADVPHSETTT